MLLSRSARIAAALVTLAIAIPVLMVQLRATGISVTLLIGRSTHGTQVVCIQIVKVIVTLATLLVLTLLALSKIEWSPGNLFSAAAEKSMSPDGYLSPGLWPRTANLGPLNVLGEHMVLILGTAVLPNLILRVCASRNGRSARRSTSIASGLVLPSSFS
ncbi:hypothetical protein [Streptomyces sp. NBC_01716]|uniref:hypothetical protein n=1 Tax=Streptomyces sp. NBC_01716 TaxID=2975917 RepID=UPI002E2F2907|nr:hypothetical protein [Streptomyces sp. NBC_01716]